MLVPQYEEVSHINTKIDVNDLKFDFKVFE